MRNFTLPLIHFFVWGFIIFYLPFRGQDFFNILNFSNISINLFIFYFNYFYILPNIVNKPTSKKITINVLVFFSVFLFLKYIIEEIIILKIVKYKVEYHYEDFSMFLL